MNKPDAAPLILFRTTVPQEWVDYNGHMNDACYGIACSRACDAFIDLVGMDAAFRERTGLSIYTAEVHLRYVDETKRGEAIRVGVRLAGYDAKRARLFMAVRRAEDDTLLATQDGMYLHVDTSKPAVVPFQPAVLERLKTLFAEQAGLPVPEHIGAAIKTLAHDITAA